MMMKFSLLLSALIIAAPTAVTGLQGGYLSQLKNGATAVVNNGAGGALSNGMVLTAPPPVAPAAGGSITFGMPAPINANGPSPEMLDLWSRQVSVELQASQLYLSAYIWFSARKFAGMAAWMLDESGEEREHGLAILGFAMQRNFPVALDVLVEPPTQHWTTPLAVWEDILVAEQTNTQNLLRIADAANACGDYSAAAFLNPFHLEQVEAEDKVSTIVAKVADATPSFMVQLDHELGLEAAAEEGH